MQLTGAVHQRAEVFRVSRAALVRINGLDDGNLRLLWGSASRNCSPEVRPQFRSTRRRIEGAFSRDLVTGGWRGGVWGGGLGGGGGGGAGGVGGGGGRVGVVGVGG